MEKLKSPEDKVSPALVKCTSLIFSTDSLTSVQVGFQSNFLKIICVFVQTAAEINSVFSFFFFFAYQNQTNFQKFGSVKVFVRSLNKTAFIYSLY